MIRTLPSQVKQLNKRNYLTALFSNDYAFVGSEYT